MAQIALITGSSRGIGKAIAFTLADKGYDVIVHYNKNKKAAEEVAKQIETKGRKSWVVQSNLVKDDEVERMFVDISKFTDTIDVVVNNAGFDYAKLIEDYTMEEIRYVIDIVLTSKMSVTIAALPFLKKSKYPSIINISSRMGKEKTIPTIGAYGPPEAGIMKWTQCCAVEFMDYRIRVNCVAPGLTDTDLTRNTFLDLAGGDQKLADDNWEAASKRNTRGRVGQPQDVANLIAFLVSEQADYINGETFGVNGGSNLV